jgi:hypothetical protein
VVFTTGYDRTDLSGYAGVSLLKKPFTPAELAKAVQECLMTGRALSPSERVAC